MTAVYGYQAKLGIHANSPVEQRFDFLSESLAVNESFVDTNGLRGVRDHSIERLRQGIRHIGGQIRMQPTAVELAGLLPWILGANASGNTYAIADTLQTRNVVVDRIAKVFSYSGVVVDRATIRGNQGEALELLLDVCAIDESVGNSGTFPSLSLDTTTGPFVHTDGVFSINSTEVSARSFEVTIDNRIDKERFFNSLTATALLPMDRIVTMSTQLPYGDAYTLYGTGVGGVAATLTFTNGLTSLVLTMPKVAFPRRSPTYTAGRAEQMLPLQGQCYRSGSTASITCTLDSAP